MILEPQIPQHPGEVIDVGSWEADTEFEYSLQGAKPKRTLVCPNPPPRGFLIGSHRYVFKSPAGRSINQIWSEVIAYELGRAAGVSVPPAFLAYDFRSETPGVLIEFFYGYTMQPPLRFVHAIEVFQGSGHVIDFKHGSLRENVKLCRALKITDWKPWWARTIAFDAVTGNNDRHSMNWGFLVSAEASAPQRYSLAPPFDNGTSLGFAIRDQELARYLEPSYFERFLTRGSHHVNWLPGAKMGARSAELCRQFESVFGPDRDAMSGVLNLTDSAIDGIINWCVRFDFPVPFTAQRGEFVAKLIKARRGALVEALGG